MIKESRVETWSGYSEAVKHMEEKDNFRFNRVANSAKELKVIKVCNVPVRTISLVHSLIYSLFIPQIFKCLLCAINTIISQIDVLSSFIELT